MCMHTHTHTPEANKQLVTNTKAPKINFCIYEQLITSIISLGMLCLMKGTYRYFDGEKKGSWEEKMNHTAVFTAHQCVGYNIFNTFLFLAMLPPTWFWNEAIRRRLNETIQGTYKPFHSYFQLKSKWTAISHNVSWPGVAQCIVGVWWIRQIKRLTLIPGVQSPSGSF